MKKLLFLLLVVPTIGFSQYSKKEKKILSKLKIMNKGINMDEVIVPIYTGNIDWRKKYENTWKDALFMSGFNVSDYSTKLNSYDTRNGLFTSERTNNINGRYLLDIGECHSFPIKDLKTNEIVAIIKSEENLCDTDFRNGKKIEQIINVAINKLAAINNLNKH